MRMIVQRELDQLRPNRTGFTHCETGDYTHVIFDKNKKYKFPRGCYFDDESQFGNSCEFGSNCDFGEECVFGEDCSFGHKCTFDEKCTFGSNCTFSLNCEIGTWPTYGNSCEFGENCNIGKHAVYGDFSTYGKNCKFEDIDSFVGGFPYIKLSGFGEAPASPIYFFNLKEGIYIRSESRFELVDSFIDSLDKENRTVYNSLFNLCIEKFEQWDQ